MSEQILQIGSTKQEFKLSNGNIVLLDTHDFNVIQRLNAEMDSFINIENEIKAFQSTKSDDMASIANFLSSIDIKLRAKIDTIFDSPVSDPCCGNANMCDCISGTFRFEQIIMGLMSAFEHTMKSEVSEVQKRMNKAKNKYNV